LVSFSIFHLPKLNSASSLRNLQIHLLLENRGALLQKLASHVDQLRGGDSLLKIPLKETKKKPHDFMVRVQFVQVAGVCDTKSRILSLLLSDEMRPLSHHAQQSDTKSPDVVTLSGMPVVSLNVGGPVGVRSMGFLVMVNVVSRGDLSAIGNDDVNRIP
jgi:hypothetical protein